MSTKTLMHPIEAQNHRDNGYFPTDTASVVQVLMRLIPHQKPLNILDPCCGCGRAVSMLREHFEHAHITGIELDETRANQARGLLDEVHISDIYATKIARASVDLMFLNPPYGRTLTDKLDEDSESKRIEHVFLSRVYPALKAGGVMVYIVPWTSFDDKRKKWFLANFVSVDVFAAATQKYKQVIVIGEKLKTPRAVLKDMLDKLDEQVEIARLGNEMVTTHYELPSSTKQPKVTLSHIDATQLEEELAKQKLWRRFDAQFDRSVQYDFAQPLHGLSDWHLALMIASGAVQGIVDNGKRCLLVKGRTRKVKVVSQKTENTETESVAITERKDRFITVINAIDITPRSNSFGEIVVIK